MENVDNDWKPFRVLTLDGGGMGGLYTVALLDQLIRQFVIDKNIQNDPDLGAQFDLVAGTSTGAILGAGLASGVSLSEILNLYDTKGPTIFPHPMPPREKGRIIWSLTRATVFPAARKAPLKKALQEVFQSETMKQMYDRRGIAFLAPSIWATNSNPRVFKTGHIPGKHMDDNLQIVDICLASAAAPVFFPIHSHENPAKGNEVEHYVDGGLWANNPVLVGLTEALQMAEKNQPIEILSVGTATQPSVEEIKMTDRGLMHWTAGIDIASMSMKAQAMGHALMAEFIAKELSKAGRSIRIHRLEEVAICDRIVDLSYATELDASSEKAREGLKKAGRQDGVYNHSKLLKSEENWLIEILSTIKARKRTDACEGT